MPIVTRFMPKRADELVGGSIYWIVKHRIAARQTILGFDVRASDRKTIIRLDPELVPVRATAKRGASGLALSRRGRCAARPRTASDDLEALPPDLAGKLAVLALI